MVIPKTDYKTKQPELFKFYQFTKNTWLYFSFSLYKNSHLYTDLFIYWSNFYISLEKKYQQNTL